ncbi:MAG: hypothetical protein ABII19_03950 [Patescibacteria group bacterium]
MTTQKTRSGWRALHERCQQVRVSLSHPLRGTLNRPSGKKRVPRTPLAGDLLRPKTLKDLLARQAEERRLAEEAEDRYYAGSKPIPSAIPATSRTAALDAPDTLHHSHENTLVGNFFILTQKKFYYIINKLEFYF